MIGTLRAGFLLLAFCLAAAAPPAAADDPQRIDVANAGFEEGSPGAPPQAWGGSIASGAASAHGYRVVNDADRPHGGKASARLESVGEAAGDAFGALATHVDAAPYRGKRIRLTGAVRVALGAGAWSGLWLRVDRPNNGMGFFDNMQDRPIRGADWAEHVIEGDVAPDATNIVFGLLLAGPGKAWLDDVRLEVVGPAKSAGLITGMGRPRTAPGPGDVAPRPLDRRSMTNLDAFARLYGYVRFFHPSDEAAAADWDAFALAGVEQVERAAGPAELAATLRNLFKPIAPTIEISAGQMPPAIHAASGPARALRWHHVGLGTGAREIYHSDRIVGAPPGPDDVLSVALPGGVFARIPLAVPVGPGGKTLPGAGGTPPGPAKPAGFVPSGFDRTTRLAAVIEGWTVFQHFYPYFDVVKTDWPAALRAGLATAATDRDDLAFADTLSRLIAALHDGHGRVVYPSPDTALLPVDWDWVESKLVVTAAEPGGGLAPGDVVTRIDGVAAAAAIARQEGLTSGSPQFVRQIAMAKLRRGRPDVPAILDVVGRDGGRHKVRLIHKAPGGGNVLAGNRRPPFDWVEPGILYVDLSRATEEAMQSHEADFAKARALIYDVRRYPAVTPGFFQHLTSRAIHSARFEEPTWLAPDHKRVSYEDAAWTITPAPPRYTSDVVFLSGPNAVSYAESVLGVVSNNRLAPIVGEPSAGTNGDVNSIIVAGGYRLSWTGLRVVNRDGSQHHLVGVRPTVEVRQTITGIRAGKDEVLERALALARARLPQAAAR